jgi:hypothetical protein
MKVRKLRSAWLALQDLPGSPADRKMQSDLGQLLAAAVAGSEYHKLGQHPDLPVDSSPSLALRPTQTMMVMRMVRDETPERR